ncbi:unnamed protein product [Heligmosomoides polygyrus]|uniref:Reverse transcriptase domain-containing protein n=1 Tax=Heligmosomoides polygyrus TaxID=6339 RepID=A0A183GG11_HELPZ|nr:unnamed protein product [Heligmosomoides polygyrus]
MKVYERLVDSRVREMVTISQEQWGFMPERKHTTRYPGPCSGNPLRGRSVPERLISVIKDMYEGSKAPVRTPYGMTKKMDITVGVHQGSALSPFLFVLTLDCIVNRLEEGPLRTILYAKHIALLADSREELEEKVQLWQVALADNGLRLNVKKTKFISSE